jgi:hypothetical protein
MPNLHLPSFTPNPLDSFTARPALTLDPENRGGRSLDLEDRALSSSSRGSSILDPEDIHIMPDIDNSL